MWLTCTKWTFHVLPALNFLYLSASAKAENVYTGKAEHRNQLMEEISPIKIMNFNKHDDKEKFDNWELENTNKVKMSSLYFVAD